MLGGPKGSSVHFICTGCQIVLISLLAGPPCRRENPHPCPKDNEHSGANPFKEALFASSESATESGTGPRSWIQASLLFVEAGSLHRGSIVVTLPCHLATIIFGCCRTICTDQRLGARRGRSPPVSQVPRLLLVVSASITDSQESLSAYGPTPTLPAIFSSTTGQETLETIQVASSISLKYLES